MVGILTTLLGICSIANGFRCHTCCRTNGLICFRTITFFEFSAHSKVCKFQMSFSCDLQTHRKNKNKVSCSVWKRNDDESNSREYFLQPHLDEWYHLHVNVQVHLQLIRACQSLVVWIVVDCLWFETTNCLLHSIPSLNRLFGHLTV